MVTEILVLLCCHCGLRVVGFDGQVFRMFLCYYIRSDVFVAAVVFWLVDIVVACLIDDIVGITGVWLRCHHDTAILICLHLFWIDSMFWLLELRLHCIGVGAVSLWLDFLLVWGGYRIYVGVICRFLWFMGAVFLWALLDAGMVCFGLFVMSLVLRWDTRAMFYINVSLSVCCGGYGSFRRFAIQGLLLR
eukprot:gene2975-1957_t